MALKKHERQNCSIFHTCETPNNIWQHYFCLDFIVAKGRLPHVCRVRPLCTVQCFRIGGTSLHLSNCAGEARPSQTGVIVSIRYYGRRRHSTVDTTVLQKDIVVGLIFCALTLMKKGEHEKTSQHLQHFFGSYETCAYYCM